uniref:ADAM10 cysteine-rich domain-containing protein n=1 Tax=Magallana gigas TaxID=29159 RepID=A0A8W8NPU6_MAGGI
MLDRGSRKRLQKVQPHGPLVSRADSVKKPNLKYCNEYSQVCQQGFCTGSLCLKVGTPENGTSPGVWEECFVTLPGDLTVQQKEQLCYLACKKNDTNAVCYATNQNLDSSNALYALLQDVNQRKQSSGGIKLAAGSPCNNYQGYCDVFSRCRGVDNEGPLQRLKNLIFNEKTLANIKNWIIVPARLQQCPSDDSAIVTSVPVLNILPPM